MREDGSLLLYPRLPRPDGEKVLPVEGDRLPLVHGGVSGDETSYEIRDPHTGLVRTFTSSPYRDSTAYWLGAIQDRNDNRVDFSRRPDGAPTAVSHSGGYVVQVTADDSRVTSLSVREPEGPVTVVGYDYDPAGDLTGLTGPEGPDGPALSFTYDGDGRITSWTDRNGSTFRYVYDAEGRVSRTLGPDGILSSHFSYGTHPETGHHITRYTDSTGATTLLHSTTGSRSSPRPTRSATPPTCPGTPMTAPSPAPTRSATPPSSPGTTPATSPPSCCPTAAPPPPATTTATFRWR